MCNKLTGMELTSETLKESLDFAIKSMVKEFGKKQYLEFEFFVSDDVLDVVCFGNVYYFNVQDIYHDLFAKQPKGLIIQWLHDNLDSKEYINYKSYCMGLRHNKNE